MTPNYHISVFTLMEGNAVGVNLDNVASFAALDDGTKLYLVGGETLYINEPYGDVIKAFTDTSSINADVLNKTWATRASGIRRAG